MGLKVASIEAAEREGFGFRPLAGNGFESKVDAEYTGQPLKCFRPLAGNGFERMLMGD